MNQLLSEAAQWLEEQGRENPFGEAGVNVVFHEGHIVRIDKSSTVKIKPTNNGVHRNGNNR